MPKKRRKTIVIILTILTIGIGGKFYMDKREMQRQKDLLAVEKQSVKVLKNTFADIKEVKIEKSARNEMTGSYRIVILMTNKQDQSIYFSYSFWKERNEIGSYGIVDEKKQKEGNTLNKVKVTYSNGNEESI
ncbi:hypothetical protein I5172_05485 [Enterococcus faecium]|uniref:DUF1310 family protein n=2 Tax=Enterococcus faecium TaxID=1352 RepID=A0A1Y3HZR2_ENTFC|nr:MULTISPECIES: hypothetical protein [Enterococcus]HAQ1404528.1 hypothetical protein [Enterococcus faecium Ef_aus0069]ALZ51357.1 hypothetical protein AWJ25_03510 [Enterococcus faecium]ANB94285.1 hypothetical protein XM37_09090 [Enterococcus faecium]AOM21507.1 hypothetical protein AL016_03570 [Enterococcus faecium]AOM27948.1 hypothetical protein AL018_05715 [Enterococcus faecium]